MLKVQEIRELIKLIDESSIDEFTYESDDATVSMKKTTTNLEVKQAPAPEQSDKNISAPSQVEPLQSAPAEQRKPEQANEEAKEEPSGATAYDSEIVSPMVGTFYASPSPESDPYVQVGSVVNNESIVCIVEAMKLFNEIEAETKGEIVEILADDGELVEYGQPLFRVKTQ